MQGTLSECLTLTKMAPKALLASACMEAPYLNNQEVLMLCIACHGCFDRCFIILAWPGIYGGEHLNITFQIFVGTNKL